VPLQNRVTPFGEIVADPARGAMFGNRGGCLHDGEKRLGRRRWASRAWICCVLEFKGRRRALMQPNRYTELFFLDEATAFAAGHRPCFECRRADALRFRDAFGARRADEMDRPLHGERLGPKPEVAISELPEGAMVARDGAAWLVWRGALRRWSFTGYREARPLDGRATLLTPRSTVAAFRRGYRPAARLESPCPAGAGEEEHAAS
jgi:hypothetical protein